MGVQASNKTGLEGLERRGQSGSPELNERRIFGWRGQMGNEYAVKAMLTTSAMLFKASAAHTPGTVMRWLRPADFVMEDDLVPVGVSGDSPAQQICMDLCERWLWVIYITMINCGEMLTSLTFAQAQKYQGERAADGSHTALRVWPFPRDGSVWAGGCSHGQSGRPTQLHLLPMRAAQARSCSSRRR
jgi:hypothetical protein